MQKHRGVYTCRSKSSQAGFRTDWEMTLMAFGIQISQLCGFIMKALTGRKAKRGGIT